MNYLYGKTALITGASSGIGRAIAAALSARGYHVYGTTRRETDAPAEPGGLLGFFKLIQMDVTDQASVEAAVGKVIRAEGRLGVLINCAGSGIAGAVEDTSAEEAAAQFDVNVFGPIRVMGPVVKHMRLEGGGIVINIGSVAGILAIPYQAMYSASKAALASITSALRMELRDRGVRAVIIEPGDTRTGFTGARQFTRGARENPAYRDSFERAIYAMARDEINGAPPETVAAAVLKCLKRRNPPARMAVGFGYKVLCVLGKWVPVKLVNFVVGKMYSGKLPEDAVWSFDKNIKGGAAHGNDASHSDEKKHTEV